MAEMHEENCKGLVDLFENQRKPKVEDVGLTQAVYAGDVRKEHVLPESEIASQAAAVKEMTSKFPGPAHSLHGTRLVAEFEAGFLVVKLEKVYSVEVSQDSFLYPEHHTLRVAYEDTTVHVTGRLTKTTADRLAKLIQEYLAVL